MTDKLMGNFIWKFENSTLPTNIVLDGFQYPIIRTTYTNKKLIILRE